MLNKFLTMNQPVCIVLWLVIVYNLFFPLPGAFHTVFLYALPVLIVVHFFEWLLLRGKLKQLGHEGTAAFSKVMVYGLFWWVPIVLTGNSASTRKQ